MISIDSKIKRINLPISVMNDGSLGMLNKETGKYVVFNGIGALIWNYAEEPIAINDLIRKLADGFNVTYDVCAESVIAFLKNLKKENLIEIISL